MCFARMLCVGLRKYSFVKMRHYWCVLTQFGSWVLWLFIFLGHRWRYLRGLFTLWGWRFKKWSPNKRSFGKIIVWTGQFVVRSRRCHSHCCRGIISHYTCTKPLLALSLVHLAHLSANLLEISGVKVPKSQIVQYTTIMPYEIIRQHSNDWHGQNNSSIMLRWCTALWEG